jgi:hypothetical protein
VQIGAILPAAAAEEYEREGRGARAALGEAGVAAELAEGRAGSAELAVCLALEESGRRSARP